MGVEQLPALLTIELADQSMLQHFGLWADNTCCPCRACCPTWTAIVLVCIKLLYFQRVPQCRFKRRTGSACSTAGNKARLLKHNVSVNNVFRSSLTQHSVTARMHAIKIENASARPPRPLPAGTNRSSMNYVRSPLCVFDLALRTAI